MLDTYKRYYDLKLYTKEDLSKFVAGGKITAEQYTEITRDTYVAPEVSSVIADLKEESNLNNVGVVLTGAALLSRIKDLEEEVSKLGGVSQ